MNLVDMLGGGHSDAYRDYANEMDRIAGDEDPYIGAGNQSLHDLMSRYAQMLNNPNFLQDEVASGYKESPFAKMQSKYLTNQLNNNAAALGNLGSSYASNNLAGTLQRLISGDENNYINRGMGTYYQGLGGEQGINSMGYNALQQKNSLLGEGAYSNLQGQLSHENALQGLIGEGAALAGKLLTGGSGNLVSWLSGLLHHTPQLPAPASTSVG